MKMRTDERNAAAIWLDASMREYVTAAAYGSLATQLIRLGAPTDMIVRTQQSALRAVYHHERCAELAEQMGASTSLPTIPESTETSTITDAAITAFRAGVLGEAFSINLLRRLEKSIKPELAQDINSLIVDDQVNLGLARDIIAWCVEEQQGCIVDLHEAARKVSADTPVGCTQITQDATDAWKEAVLESTWWLTTAVS